MTTPRPELDPRNVVLDDTVDLLGHATEFAFPLCPDGHDDEDIAMLAITVAWRGPGDPRVITSLGQCFDRADHAVREGRPSERGDHVLDTFRFSRDDAVRDALDVVVPLRRGRYERLVANTRQQTRSAAVAPVLSTHPHASSTPS